MADAQNAAAEENIPAETHKDAIYVGKEELEYFLSLMNRLGDLKYMPADKIIEKAQSAIVANRLSQSVLINNQMFDGTQNISFDEYAKAVDVLNKTDCAVAGAEDNSNKVVTLNKNGKVNGDFIDYEYIVKQINEVPFEQMEANLQAQKEKQEKDFATLSAENQNQSTDIAAIKNFVGMKQAKVSVKKAPGKVTINDVEYESYCTPPIEVLKNFSTSKSDNLDYVKLKYRNKQGADCTIKANSISMQPKMVKKSLLIREGFPEVNMSNYKDHPDALQKSLTFTIDGKNNYVLATTPVEISEVGQLAELSLAQPDGEFYCAVFVDDKILYRINNDALEKCYDASDKTLVSDNDADIDAAQAVFINAIKATKKGTANTLPTMDMLRTLKKGNVKIIFCTEQEFKPACPDMTIGEMPKEGFIFDTDVALSAQIKEIKSISAQSTCTNGEIRFGIRKTNTAEHAVWDASAKAWKTISSEKEIAANGTLVEDMANIPVTAWNMNNMDYVLVFAFVPLELDASCTLEAIAVSYVDAVCYEKAVHGTDYGYSLGRSSIAMTFKTAGDYLINYPATDILPLYNRTVAVLPLE